MISTKDDHTLRIGFQNIGGLTYENNNTYKDELLREGVNNFQFDNLGLAETNTDWRLVDKASRLYNWTKGWWESLHLSLSFNCTQPPAQRQRWGGTAIISINKAAHCVAERGIDNSKLGRWSWNKFRGKNNHLIHVFVAYCPNPPSGPLSVYAQHRSFLLLRNDEKCPREAFLQDISADIASALANEEKVILMLDRNHNMKKGNLADQLSRIGLHEAIIDKYGTNGPSTFRRNTARTPIDGIWISQDVKIHRGGYFEYDQFILNADHRCIWVDIKFGQAFGHNWTARDFYV
jgi:hypothetical protein